MPTAILCRLIPLIEQLAEVVHMKLYSYVITRDYGFAPNPFYQYCTLATCKPVIRRTADVNDIIVGIGSGAKNSKFKDKIIFAMKVEEKLTYDQYWDDSRFLCKRPNMGGSKKQMYGDNIYHTDSKTKTMIQENSHHSLEGGKTNEANFNRDVPGKFVLISQKFWYWGGEPIHIPERFLELTKAKRQYTIIKDTGFIFEFSDWLESLNKTGYIHKPFEFSQPFKRYNGE